MIALSSRECDLVLFISEKNSVKEALEQAVGAGINLRKANLAFSNLTEARLRVSVRRTHIALVRHAGYAG